MGFWGIIIECQKPVKVTLPDPPKRLRLTQVTIRDGTELAYDDRNNITKLFCKVGDMPRICICSLASNRVETFRMDLEFKGPSEIEFYVTGSRDVEIAGYYFQEHLASFMSPMSHTDVKIRGALATPEVQPSPDDPKEAICNEATGSPVNLAQTDLLSVQNAAKQDEYTCPRVVEVEEESPLVGEEFSRSDSSLKYETSRIPVGGTVDVVAELAKTHFQTQNQDTVDAHANDISNDGAINAIVPGTTDAIACTEHEGKLQRKKTSELKCQLVGEQSDGNKKKKRKSKENLKCVEYHNDAEVLRLAVDEGIGIHSRTNDAADGSKSPVLNSQQFDEQGNKHKKKKTIIKEKSKLVEDPKDTNTAAVLQFSSDQSAVVCNTTINKKNEIVDGAKSLELKCHVIDEQGVGHKKKKKAKEMTKYVVDPKDTNRFEFHTIHESGEVHNTTFKKLKGIVDGRDEQEGAHKNRKRITEDESKAVEDPKDTDHAGMLSLSVNESVIVNNSTTINEHNGIDDRCLVAEGNKKLCSTGVGEKMVSLALRMQANMAMHIGPTESHQQTSLVLVGEPGEELKKKKRRKKNKLKFVEEPEDNTQSQVLALCSDDRTHVNTTDINLLNDIVDRQVSSAQHYVATGEPVEEHKKSRQRTKNKPKFAEELEDNSLALCADDTTRVNTTDIIVPNGIVDRSLVAEGVEKLRNTAVAAEMVVLALPIQANMSMSRAPIARQKVRSSEQGGDTKSKMKRKEKSKFREDGKDTNSDMQAAS